MRATAEPEEGNKVRLSVEIDEAEIEEALGEVMRRLATEVRVPGFRPGKVPRKVIEARMGGVAALRGEALQQAIPDAYSRAVVETEIDPIDQPDIEVTSEGDTGPVTFDAVVLVRPSVAVIGYGGLSVELPALAVSDEQIQEQIDRMRATSGELAEVSRPVAAEDQVTIDIKGTRNLAADADPEAEVDDSDLVAEDFLYRAGSNMVLPELDEHLIGSEPGSTFSFESVVDDEEGVTATFEVTVKTVKELVLPDADDAWAAEASEFDTVEELRADLAERLAERNLTMARMALQQKTLDALVELVTEEVPEQLVNAEMHERIHDLNHRLEGQGMNVSQFLAATGRTEEDFVAELRVGAVQSVKADLGLRAVADAEEMTISDEELDEELAKMAEQLNMATEDVRSQLDQAGRLPAVRSDLRKAKAMRWLTEHVELVDEHGAPVDRDALAEHENEENEQ